MMESFADPVTERNCDLPATYQRFTGFLVVPFRVRWIAETWGQWIRGGWPVFWHLWSDWTDLQRVPLKRRLWILWNWSISAPPTIPIKPNYRAVEWWLSRLIRNSEWTWDRELITDQIKNVEVDSLNRRLREFLYPNVTAKFLAHKLSEYEETGHVYIPPISCYHLKLQSIDKEGMPGHLVGRDPAGKLACRWRGIRLHQFRFGDGFISFQFEIEPTQETAGELPMRRLAALTTDQKSLSLGFDSEGFPSPIPWQPDGATSVELPLRDVADALLSPSEAYDPASREKEQWRFIWESKPKDEAAIHQVSFYRPFQVPFTGILETQREVPSGKPRREGMDIGLWSPTVRRDDAAPPLGTVVVATTEHTPESASALAAAEAVAPEVTEPSSRVPIAQPETPDESEEKAEESAPRGFWSRLMGWKSDRRTLDYDEDENGVPEVTPVAEDEPVAAAHDEESARALVVASLPESIAVPTTPAKVVVPESREQSGRRFSMHGRLLSVFLLALFRQQKLAEVADYLAAPEGEGKLRSASYLERINYHLGLARDRFLDVVVAPAAWMSAFWSRMETILNTSHLENRVLPNYQRVRDDYFKGRALRLLATATGTFWWLLRFVLLPFIILQILVVLPVLASISLAVVLVIGSFLTIAIMVAQRVHQKVREKTISKRDFTIRVRRQKRRKWLLSATLLQLLAIFIIVWWFPELRMHVLRVFIILSALTIVAVIIAIRVMKKRGEKVEEAIQQETLPMFAFLVVVISLMGLLTFAGYSATQAGVGWAVINLWDLVTGNQSLEVVSPIAGEHYEPGDELTIEWKRRGKIELIGIELSTWEGDTIIEEAYFSQSNEGSYIWTIPRDMEPTRCSIRIFKAGQEDISDTSGVFRIGPEPPQTQPMTMPDE